MIGVTRSAPSLWFFIAASTWAAISVPLWLATWTGLLEPCSGCDPVARHGHEMVAGYGWAVVVGFLATRASIKTVWTTLLLWTAARIATTFGIGLLIAAPLSLAFSVLLFATAGMPFVRAAKTARNMMFAPMIAVFAIAEALYWAGASGLLRGADRNATLLMLGMVALLLFIMGGRIVPVATAGALRQRGVELERRPSPRAEWAGIAGLALAGISHGVGLAAPTGIGALIAGAAALYRLAHWRPPGPHDLPEIWSLQIGYAWLGVGLVLLAAGHFAVLPIGPGVHAVGMGGLGTLAYTMMVRATQQRTKRAIRCSGWLAAGTVLISAAAVLRILGSVLPWLMIAAATCWSIAHVGLAAYLLRCILLPAGRTAPTKADDATGQGL